AIGFSLARNLIGWSEFGGPDQLEAKAYTADSDLEAENNIELSAVSTATINAVVEATAAALAASTDSAVGVSAAGLWTDNKIAADIAAYIDGAASIEAGGDLSLTAEDHSTITADAQAVAVSASLSGSTGGAVSIGVSLAHNTIANEISAYIDGADSVAADDVIVSASDEATIHAS